MTTTQVLETPDADLTYDLHGPVPTPDGRPPLFMIGQPMQASGFTTLASFFPDRTVVTYDPRGLGRSARKDGRVDHDRQFRRTTCTRSSRRWASGRCSCSRAAAVP
jgi:pimeloyl-ACP methyl ester carboxylesterase